MMAANSSIDRDIMPSKEQWDILEDVENTQHTMSKWQRVFEGEKFLTASLVMIAVYNIRANYAEDSPTRL